jgi:putative membrane protein
MKPSWLLVAALVAGACGGDDEEEQADRPAAERPTARRDSVERQPVYPEAEAAQILRAIGANEIEVSRVARERSQNDDILRYASVMISDHREIAELLDSLVAPISDSVNAESRALRQAGSELVDSLWKLEGGFNNTYIQQQIAAHEQALLLLDTALIPSARNPQLKKLLRDLRPAVVAHLQRAQQIWSERQASGAAAATAAAAAAAAGQPAATPTVPRAAPAPAPSPADTVPAASTTNMR